jgi:hypothetical protein
VLEFASFSEGGKLRLFRLDFLVRQYAEYSEPTSGLEPLTSSLYE